MGLLLAFLFGAAVLLAGNELTVRGMQKLSTLRKCKPCPTSRLLGWGGTSLPVFFTALQASATGSPDVALGVLTGSAIFILLFATGFFAIYQPLSLPRAQARLEGGMAAAGGLMVLVFAADGYISAQEGALAFLLLLLLSACKGRKAAACETMTDNPLPEIKEKPCRMCALAYFLIGIGMMFTGADVLADATVALARQWGKPEAVVALTLVSIIACGGLATDALRKRQQHFSPEQRAQQLVHSVLFILYGAVGMAALLNPLTVSGAFASVHLWLLLASGGFFSILLLLGPLVRTEGNVLVALYGAFLIYQLAFNA